MSPGSDEISPRKRPSVAFASKPRLRLLLLAVAAIFTWFCLELWSTLISGEDILSTFSRFPPPRDHIIGWGFAVSAVALALFLNRSWPRYLLFFIAVASILLAVEAGFDNLIDTRTRILLLYPRVATLVTPFAIVAASLTYASATSAPLMDQLRMRLPKLRFWWAFIALPLVWIGINLLWPLTPFNPVAHPDAPSQVYSLHANLGHSLLLTLLYRALLVPIGEEMLFRGLVAPHLRDALNVVWSVVLSSAIFAAFHINPLYFSLNQVLYVSCLAVTLAVTMFMTRSIWPGVVAHGINNGSVALSEFGSIG